MKLELESKIKNTKPLCLINDQLIVSKRNVVFLYDINKKSLLKVQALPVSLNKRLFMKSKILTRLLRLGIRYGIVLQDKIFVVFNKMIYEIKLGNKNVKRVFQIQRGNGPLHISEIKNVEGFENGLVFGEYFANFKKERVHIYKRKRDGSWIVAFTFPEGSIEHVHSIVPDKFNNCVWILAGDFGDAASIWMAKNNFKVVVPIVRGNQKYRSCVAFATENGLLYATDSQFEANSIRLLKKDNDQWKSIELSKINGSSIYGCELGGKVCFSTAVEGDSLSKGKFLKYFDRKPGPGIKNDESHIVMGNIEEGFDTILRRKKDLYPFILFQFGTFMFPTGVNKSERLICYDVALKGSDLNTYIYKIH
jgi:hypothetical protein